jgi:predicted 2-oxoglutarate/Fe(II)-dependent dioxygenase YbiX
MNKRLEDYVRVYKGLLDPTVCDSVIADLESCEWIQHRFYSTTGLVDNGTEPYEYHGQLSNNLDLKKQIWEALKRYILEDIKLPWFGGWNGFSNLKFIKYVEGSEMVNHCDHIQSIFDGTNRGIPVLSIIAQLNNDFTGGEFVMFDDTTIPLNKGDVIVFPSVFLYPHRINKITSGTRYSMISWSN